MRMRMRNKAHRIDRLSSPNTIDTTSYYYYYARIYLASFPLAAFCCLCLLYFNLSNTIPYISTMLFDLVWLHFIQLLYYDQVLPFVWSIARSIIIIEYITNANNSLFVLIDWALLLAGLHCINFPGFSFFLCLAKRFILVGPDGQPN